MGATALFASLDPNSLAELARLTHERKLERGEILFLEGQPAEHLFVVVSGSVRAYRVNAKGREQVIHTEKAGATLAEVPVFDDGPYPATAAAEEPSTVLALSRHDFKLLCFRHPEVAWSALRVLAGRLRRHAELINELALHDVGPRLAKFLLSEAAAHGREVPEGIHVNLPFTHQQLSVRIGSVREVVSRTLARFEREGLISGQTEGGLIILDRPALEAYAKGL